MIHIYSPEEVLKMCKPCFGGWDLEYRSQKISGVYINDDQEYVTKEMTIKILDKINTFFPFHWCETDILCLPFRPMLKDKNSNWTGTDFNGQAWQKIIALGAQLKSSAKASASAMIVHELWHDFSYTFIDTNPFDGSDTPEYREFKRIMGIENYSDKDIIWEHRPCEILAELGRYYAQGEDFTGESFTVFNSKVKPLREAYDYLMSFMPEKPKCNKDFIENRNSSVVNVPDKKEAIIMVKKIGTDVGHGGRDSGSVGANGLQEKDVTLNVGLKLNELLINNNFAVITTRIKDEFLELKERTDIFNKAKCDMAISIHVNASSTSKTANYIATYIYGKDGQAEKIANCVQKQLVSATKWSDGGVRVENFHMTRETDMPAILVELGFISNLEQEKWLSNKDNQDKLAVALCKGICDYYGIEYKEENKMAGYVGYKISSEVPIVVDGQEIKMKAAKIEIPGQGGVTFLPVRDFLQDIIRDKYGIDLEIGYDGRVLLNKKKQ